MKQKMFLTSALAMGFVAPAMAVPTNTGEFPSGGLMQADYTYTNAATSTNMAGVYEGTVDAVAQYTDVLYQIAAGKYLPAGTETVINCNQPGYFCPGVSGDVYYDEDNAQGLTSCSTVGDGSYTSSDGTGSTADTCYRQCSGNVTFAHATEVSGNDYYGNGTDTCKPTACENGYHPVEAVPDLESLIGSTEKIGYEYYEYNDYGVGPAFSGSPVPQAVINSLHANGRDWAINFGDAGSITGTSACSTTAGNGTDTYTSVSNGRTNNHKYCYCNLTGYAPAGGSVQTLSVPWLYIDAFDYSDTIKCDKYCPRTCINKFSNSKQRYFNLLTPGPAMCEANTITINWNGTTQAAIKANNAGTATYGSDVRTPQSASHVPGKTFTGWRFVAPQQTNLPD